MAVSAGMNTQTSVAPMPKRGVRRPRHLGGAYAMEARRLYPWMAHPLRPGETLLDVNIQGEAYLNSLIQLHCRPMMYGELGLFLVPLSALPAWFKDIFTEDITDISRKGGGEYLRGAAIQRDDEVDEGFQNIGMDERSRPWAGELGSSTDASAYIPYVSRSINQIARDWYGSAESHDLGDGAADDLPPFVADYVEASRRSALQIPSADVIQDPNPTTDDSFWNMLDALFLTSTIERTYSDYLAANSSDPRRVDGMTRPLMGQHKFFQAQENPMLMSGYDAGVINIVNTEGQFVDPSFGSANVSTTPDDTNDGFVYDHRPIGSLKSDYSLRRRRNVFIEEPTILIGTFVHYTEFFGFFADAQNDIIHLANAGHWGDRSFGDVSEEDFLDVRQLARSDGTTSPGGPYMQNLLHLFMHGDVFFNTNNNDGAINFRAPGGDSLNAPGNQRVTGRFSAQLSIASDLVGGG